MTQGSAQGLKQNGEILSDETAGFYKSAGVEQMPQPAPALSEEEIKKKKKKAHSDFLFWLMQYYQRPQEYFDSLEAADKSKITPFLEAFSVVSHPQTAKEIASKPLVARNMLGSQMPFNIRTDSVKAEKGTKMTIELAIDMALAAKANPMFADGVDVNGNAAERAMLAAAAELVGLKVLNSKKVDMNLVAQYRQGAHQAWSELKKLTAQRDAIENADNADNEPGKESAQVPPSSPPSPPPAPGAKEEIKPEASVPEEKSASSAYDSLSPDQKVAVNDSMRDDFKGQNISDEELKNIWDNAPDEYRDDVLKKLAEKQTAAEPSTPAKREKEAAVVAATPEPIDYSALPSADREKIKDSFHALNAANEAKTPDEAEIARRWDEIPEGARRSILKKDFPVPAPVTASAAPAQEAVSAPTLPLGAQQTVNVIVSPQQAAATPADATADMKPVTADSSVLGTGFAVAVQLPPPAPSGQGAVDKILEQGGVSHGLYELVKLRVIEDNDARVKHVEDIIGFDNNIPGSKKAASIILKALEADGVVAQDRPNGPRRVIGRQEPPVSREPVSGNTPRPA